MESLDRDYYPTKSSSDSRRVRRRRERETEEYEAGPSRPSESRREAKRSRSSGQAKPKDFVNGSRSDVRSATQRTFDIGDDYVPFDLSDESPPPANEDRERGRGQDREWDRGKGKGKARDQVGGAVGQKRTHSMVDNDDEVYPKASELQARRAPWLSNVNWEGATNVAQMLHREVEAFTDYISPTPVEDEIRSLTVTMISNAVSKAFPDAKVVPFGSYATKLYLPLGDIDLVILSESMAYSDKVTVLRALANTIKHAGITSNVTVIAKTRVPIIKFVTNHGRFNVDISINHESGVYSGQIVRGFIEDMDGGAVALRSLIMIAKAFLSQRSMNEVYTGGLGSYSVVCLAVSFLQMHPKIRRGEIDPEHNLGVLVMEFFEFYGLYFNYEEVGISLRDGGTYFSKRQRGWMDRYKKGLLSIEDPAEPSHDLSKGSFGIAKVRTSLAGAHGILTAAAYQRSSIMNSMREGQYYRLRRPDAQEDWSLLSTVMGITQETINHRRLVQEVYDKRTLHRLLGISPKASIVIPDPLLNGISIRNASRTTHTSSARAAQSVQSVWAEADIGSDDVQPRAPVADTRRRKGGHDEQEENGRYDIGKQQPLRKRQKTGNKREDTHTVFTTDDDEEAEDELIATPLDGEGGLEEEEGEYDIGDLKTTSRGSGSNASSRRSYWLSKGIGFQRDSE